MAAAATLALCTGCPVQRIDYDLGDLAFQPSRMDEASESAVFRRIYKEDRAMFVVLGSVPVTSVNPVRALKTLAKGREIRHVRISSESSPMDWGITLGSALVLYLAAGFATSATGGGGTAFAFIFLPGLMLIPTSTTVRFQADVVHPVP